MSGLQDVTHAVRRAEERIVEDHKARVEIMRLKEIAAAAE